MAEENVNLNVNAVGTDKARTDFAALKDEFTKTGTEGSQSLDKITKTLENIQAANDKVTKKMSEGRGVSVKDANLITQQFTILKKEIDDTYGSVSKAPATFQAAFKVAQQQVENTRTTVRNLTTEVKLQKNELGLAGAQWQGFGHAIEEAVGGAKARFVAFGFAALEAFKMAWEAGMKFNEAIGTNMESWNDLTKKVKEHTGELVKAAAAGTIALFTGDWKGYKTAIDDATVSLKLTHDQFKAYQILRDSGLTNEKAYKEAVAASSAVLQVHAKLIELGGAGQKQWNAIIKETKTGHEDLSTVIKNHGQAIIALIEKEEAEKIKHEELIAVQEKRIKSIQDEIKNIQLKAIALLEEAAQYGTVTDSVKRLFGVQTSLMNILDSFQDAEGKVTDSLKLEMETIVKLSGNYDGNQTVLKKLVAQLKLTADGTVNLTIAQRAQIQAVIDDQTALDGLETKHKTLKQAVDDYLDLGLERMTRAQYEDYVSKQHQLDATESQISITADKIRSDAATVTSIGTVKTATDELWAAAGKAAGSLEGFSGKIEDFGNKAGVAKPNAVSIKDAMGGIADKAKASADQIKDALTPELLNLQNGLKDLQGKIDPINAALGVTADHLKTIAERGPAAAAGLNAVANAGNGKTSGGLPSSSIQ